jgi:competence protein ComEA
VSSFTLSRRQALLVAAFALVAVFVAAHVLGGSTPGDASVGSAIAAGSTASIPALTTPESADGPAGTGSSAQGSTAQVPMALGSMAQGGGLVVVDVVGAVRAPGLYRLPQGSRIADAVARAGGMNRKADRTLVNLAAPLADGEQVLVPARAGGGTVAAGDASGAPSPSAPVDLNTATVEQLDALPGIGPVTAQKIVDYRQQHGPFTSVDDLDAIPGIGPSRIANLQGLVIA